MKSLFGLVGKRLEHSFSERYFAEKFKREGIEGVNYQLFPLDEIHLIEGLFSMSQLGGLNVTIPYKIDVIPYLEELSPDVISIGAVNCIQISEGHTSGWNTDWIGFLRSVKPFLASKHDQALVFGSGGSSKAVHYALRDLGVKTFTVSREKGKGNFQLSELTKDHINHFKLLINCTPVGMFPDINDKLPIPYDGIGSDHFVVDLIYNPEETLFLREAKNRGAMVLNGYNMLVFQAEASWKIWNAQD